MPAVLLLLLLFLLLLLLLASSLLGMAPLHLLLAVLVLSPQLLQPVLRVCQRPHQHGHLARLEPGQLPLSSSSKQGPQAACWVVLQLGQAPGQVGQVLRLTRLQQVALLRRELLCHALQELLWRLALQHCQSPGCIGYLPAAGAFSQAEHKLLHGVQRKLLSCSSCCRVCSCGVLDVCQARQQRGEVYGIKAVAMLLIYVLQLLHAVLPLHEACDLGRAELLLLLLVYGRLPLDRLRPLLLHLLLHLVRRLLLLLLMVRRCYYLLLVWWLLQM
jgi:hypothetical protein